jgi:chemotaxis protein CheD
MMQSLRNAAADHPRPAVVAGFEGIACNWDTTVGVWAAKILPGEFYITRSNEAITTVLGSCISACIRDPSLGIGGMNHFMLPEDTTQGKSAWLDEAAGLATRYGSFAMESLLNGVLKLGARRDKLEVKLFGGGHVLKASIAVGERNIDFAHNWLRAEGFSIAAEDVGSDVPRRVIYLPATGKVKVKHLRHADSQEIATRERQYLGTVAKKPAADDIELF